MTSAAPSTITTTTTTAVTTLSAESLVDLAGVVYASDLEFATVSAEPADFEAHFASALREVFLASDEPLFLGKIVITDLRSGSVIIDYLLTVGKRGARVDDLAFLATAD